MSMINSFRGGRADDGVRPDANVALAFVLAAVIVGVVGVRWMGSSSGATGARNDNGWALGATADAQPNGTEIPASPAAVAVRVGAVLTPGTASVSTTQPLVPGFPSFPGFPDDVPLDEVPPGTDPSTGPTTPGGSTPPTTRTTTSTVGSTTTTTESSTTTSTTTSSTTTTEPSTTTSTTTSSTTTSSTEVPPDEPEVTSTTGDPAPEGALDGVSAFFDAVFG